MPTLPRLAGPVLKHVTLTGTTARTWERVLVAWLLVRTLAWTAAVAFGHPNAQIDMIEWGSWGGVFQWGYPKHPPLPGWLAGAALKLSPGGVWGLYFAGYACAAVCVWVAWRLACEYMPPRRAVFAALCLDGLAYLTNDPADFSNNIVLNALWAATALVLHRAIFMRKLAWWVAVGVAVGLAILTKYSIGLLLLPVGVFVLADAPARRCLRTVGPYFSILIAATIAAPHFAWLVENNFITVTYAAERSADGGGWTTHIRNPLAFLVGQAAILLGVVFILYPVMGRSAANSDESPPRMRDCRSPSASEVSCQNLAGARAPTETSRPDTKSQLRFLHAAVLGPVAVLLLVSLATGANLRLVWASPLWTLAGVWLLACYPAEPTPGAEGRSLKRWAVLGGGILAFAVLFQLIEPHAKKNAGRTLFPGKALADEVGRRWSETFDRPFPIVAGEPWRAGNICCYSPHRPWLYSSGSMGYLVMESKHTPWTSDADLTARGGVIVWDAEQLGDALPVSIRLRFPAALDQPAIVLPYQTSAAVPPTRVGVAFVPPGG